MFIKAAIHQRGKQAPSINPPVCVCVCVVAYSLLTEPLANVVPEEVEVGDEDVVEPFLEVALAQSLHVGDFVGVAGENRSLANARDNRVFRRAYLQTSVVVVQKVGTMRYIKMQAADDSAVSVLGMRPKSRTKNQSGPGAFVTFQPLRGG